MISRLVILREITSQIMFSSHFGVEDTYHFFISCMFETNIGRICYISVVSFTLLFQIVFIIFLYVFDFERLHDHMQYTINKINFMHRTTHLTCFSLNGSYQPFIFSDHIFLIEMYLIKSKIN